MTSNKNPAFQIYPGDILRAEDLRKCSWQTRGIWWDMLCYMWFAKEQGKLRGTKDEICRMVGITSEEFDQFLEENNAHGFSNVTKRNSTVTIINRRMYKSFLQREATKKRVSDHRKKVKRKCNKKVTRHLHSPYSYTPNSSRCLNNVTGNREQSKNPAQTTTTTPIISAWQKLPLPQDKKDITGASLPAIERAISELDLDTKEPVHHSMILQAIGNYDKALRLPDSQAYKENLYNWLTKRVRKYVNYAFDLDSYRAGNFENAKPQLTAEQKAENEKKVLEARREEMRREYGTYYREKSEDELHRLRKDKNLITHWWLINEILKERGK